MENRKIRDELESLVSFIFSSVPAVRGSFPVCRNMYSSAASGLAAPKSFRASSWGICRESVTIFNPSPFSLFGDIIPQLLPGNNGGKEENFVKKPVLFLSDHSILCSTQPIGTRKPENVYLNVCFAHPNGKMYIEESPQDTRKINCCLAASPSGFLSLRTRAHTGVAIPRIFRNVRKTDKRPYKPS